MHIYFLQHHPDHGPGRFADWLTGMGHSFNTCHLYENEIPPKPSDFDALVVLDGPDSALDDTPYLHIKRERKLIQRVLNSAKPLMGIGYGGCLIAQEMGALVSTGSYPEFGWSSVRKAPDCPLNLPETFDVFHWHKEIFGLPQGALPIGSTRIAPLQGFCWDSERVISLLFHIEITATAALAITESTMACAGVDDESDAPDAIQADIKSDRRFDRLAPLLDRIMLQWLRL